MDDVTRALREEQQHLDETVHAFEQALAELRSRRSGGGADEFADEALERLRQERIRVYTEASGPLYFGRIDRIPAGPTYIGRHLVVDPRNELLAINWRAPAAEPFYAATPRDPRGITLRRRLDIEDRQVLGFVDERFAAPGEDHLTEAIVRDIMRRRVGEMRQIIATITPEQYDVITVEPTPALLIQGGPGTGKTAVGLHRAAWLLYAHPALRTAGVLVVGPNRTFIAYIDQVLPALGERTIEQRDVNSLITERRHPVHEPPLVTTLKGSGRMARLLHRMLWARVRVPVADDGVVVTVARAQVTITRDDLVALVASARATDRSYQAARMRFRARLAERIGARLADRARDPVLASAQEIATAVRQTSDYQKLSNKIWPRVAPERLVAGLYGNARALRDAAAGLLDDDELALLRSLSAPAGPGAMSATDVALLDEARWLIEPDMRTFGHVVVDEAQNLTAMELRMVVRRARRQSLTILGDIAQRTTEAGLASWKTVLADAGVDAFASRDLRVSYRVPGAFLRLAAALAGITADVPEGVRDAPWPAVAVTTPAPRIAEAAIRLAVALARDVGSVAIVASEHRLGALRSALAPMTFADATAGPLSAGINLLDLHVVKGLEFDAVITVDPAAILAQRPEGGPGALYTALTRSTRALAIVSGDELPAGLAAGGLITPLALDQAELHWATAGR